MRCRVLVSLSDRYTACPRCDACGDSSGYRSKRAGISRTSKPFRFYTTLSIFSTMLPDNRTAGERTPVSSADALKNKGLLFHGFRAVWVMTLAVISLASFERACVWAFVFEGPVSDSDCLVFRLTV